MKKNGILKSLGILLLIYVILSWIIPTGYYNNSTFTTNTILPVGLVNIIKYPIMLFTSELFSLITVCFIIIGGFYGVMKKTGLYSKLVDSVCYKFKNNEEIFLILAITVLALLSSLTSLTLPLFVFVPFVIGVILVMGYNKITALLSSVGAILVGNMASTYGFNVAGYVNFFYNTELNNGILLKIILFVLLTGGLILFVLMLNKNNKLKKPVKEEIKEIPYYEEKKKNNSKLLIPVIIMIITFILIMVGMYNWELGLDIKFFNELYKSISEIEYNNIPIVTYLIGNIGAIGYWRNYELAFILVILSFIIGKIGKLTLEEIIESFLDGAKKMLPVAIYAIFTNIIFLFMASTEYTFYATICNFFFNLSDKLGALSVGIVSAIGGVLYNDFPYMLNIISTQTIVTYDNLALVTFIQYAVHGLVQLIAPTSVLLVAGLTYLDISYKEYLKNVWKYLVGALVIIMALAVIISFI